MGVSANRQCATYVRPQAFHELRRLGEHLEHLQRRADDRRRQRIGEQVWARLLAKDVDLLPTGRSRLSLRRRFAQRRVDDVDLPLHTEDCPCRAGRAETGRVALVDEDLRPYSASAQISSSATSPSMEKTPSVTTSFTRRLRLQLRSRSCPRSGWTVYGGGMRRRGRTSRVRRARKRRAARRRRAPDLACPDSERHR